MNRLRLWKGRLLELLFWPEPFFLRRLIAQSANLLSKNRIVELLVDDIEYYDIAYYDIIIYYEALFNEMGVRPCTDSSGIGWKSGQGGG
jgi:hypothetical protein